MWLAARGWQVTAVDFSAAGLDKGRRLAQARGVGIDWVHADVRDYQPEAGSFQLVLVAYLQLRESELDSVLRRAATALAPGGVLLVVGHAVTGGAFRMIGGPVVRHDRIVQQAETFPDRLGGVGDRHGGRIVYRVQAAQARVRARSSLTGERGQKLGVAPQAGTMTGTAACLDYPTAPLAGKAAAMVVTGRPALCRAKTLRRF